MKTNRQRIRQNEMKLIYAAAQVRKSITPNMQPSRRISSTSYLSIKQNKRLWMLRSTKKARVMEQVIWYGQKLAGMRNISISKTITSLRMITKQKPPPNMSVWLCYSGLNIQKRGYLFSTFSFFYFFFTAIIERFNTTM